MKERVGPSISWFTNLDNGKQCGKTKYRILGMFKKVDMGQYGVNQPPLVNGNILYPRILIQRV